VGDDILSGKTHKKLPLKNRNKFKSKSLLKIIYDNENYGVVATSPF